MAKRKKKYNFIFILVFCLLCVFSFRGLVGLVMGWGVSAPEINKDTPQQNSDATPPVQPALTDEKPSADRYTILVNTQHPLEMDYQVETRLIKNTDKQFDASVADKFEKMLMDATIDGYPLLVVSTYRTIEYQQGLYSRKVREYLDKGYSQSAAEEEAAKWVAIPGTSEHNTGLVADIVSSDWYDDNDDLEQSFENTPHFTWLMQHCADYGFILRYPKGKEAITGIVYEPWHYRYVGYDVAHYIMDNNLTLEEYWED